MDYKELNKLSMDKLQERLLEEKSNLQKLKFAHAISPIENPIRIRGSRRTIAKINTILSSRSTTETAKSN